MRIGLCCKSVQGTGIIRRPLPLSTLHAGWRCRKVEQHARRVFDVKMAVGHPFRPLVAIQEDQPSILIAKLWTAAFAREDENVRVIHWWKELQDSFLVVFG